MKPSRAALFLLASLCFLGCNNQGSYRLHVVLPDDQAKEQLAKLSLWVLGDTSAACETLMDGSIAPDELAVRSRLTLEYPPVSVSVVLPDVPAGANLFFSEGKNQAGGVLLRGCVVSKVSAGSTVDVTIELAWICRPDPAGEIPNNAMDDDCDGLTDECVEDVDCDDRNVCTADFCSDSLCHHTNFPDTLRCDDRDACTRDDACRAGICQGIAKDCSSYNGPCVEGACRPESGECFAKATDGVSCNDGSRCTQDDICQNGQCQGTLKDCQDNDVCTKDSCDEITGECIHTVVPQPGKEGPPGDPSCSNNLDDDCDGLTDDAQDPNCVACTSNANCDDQNPCTADSCDANQVCRNQPEANGTTCADDKFCTVQEQCQDGTCRFSIRDCSSVGDACHDGVCSEPERSCVPQPKANGTSCEGGLFCTVGTQCVDGTCTGGTARDCDDGNRCTLDICDGQQAKCVNPPNPNSGTEGPPGDPSCSNNVDDDCDGLTDLADPACLQCQSAAECNDNNVCTEDTCPSGVCINSPVQNSTPCDDGNPCSTLDYCGNGLCLTGATNKDSDDDSFLDGACPGGDDCNDANPAVHPGATEGPAGDQTCLDGWDNDCDGRADLADPACAANPQVCSAGGWCWEYPIPQGNDLNAVWALGSQSVWMVGSYGSAIHWDGSAFTFVPISTDENLHGVWGTSDDNLWAVGTNGIILNWTGAQWTTVSHWTFQYLNAVFGFADNDIWAVGDNATTLHYNGSQWLDVSNTLSGEALLDVWGAASNDVWAVGQDGVIIHWNGSAWSSPQQPNIDNLHAVWGSASNDVWAVGDAGSIDHYNGSAWSIFSNPIQERLNDVWGTAGATNDAWAVADGGILYHWNGTDWGSVDSGTTMYLSGFYGVHGCSSSDVWFVGSAGSMHHWDGTDVSRLSEGFLANLSDFWAASSTDAWAVGGNAALHWDGVRWNKMDPGLGPTLWGVWGSAPDNVWVVGENGTILHWTGAWSDSFSGGPTFYDVSGSSNTDVWAVGENSAIYHWNGSSWQEQTNVPAAGHLYGVYSVSQSDAWAVGEITGGFLRWNGSTWTKLSHSSNETFFNVFGFSPNDVWAVGSYGSLGRWNGSSWNFSNLAGFTGDLWAGWGMAANDVWVAGTFGTLMHWNGSTWSTLMSGTDNLLQFVGGVSPTDVWIGGAQGTILHFRK